MKTIFFLHFLFTTLLFTQWQTDTRITNNPQNSYTSANNAWCVAANGNDLHIVWFDERDGNREIYYKRSSNSGSAWGSDIRLTNNSGNSQSPSITITGQIVMIVWQDERDGNFEIYSKRSSDGGISWGSDTRLTNNSQNSLEPSASASGQLIFITWHDERDANSEIYGKRSTDGGLSWGADIRLTNNSSVSWHSSVSVLGQVVCAVWCDNRDGNDEIYFKKSADGGNTWTVDVRLSISNSISDNPCISMTNSVIHVSYIDALEIYYNRSTNGGISWGLGTRLTFYTTVSVLPSIAVSGTFLHLAFQTNRDGNFEIYYKSSSNSGTSWNSDVRLTNNISNSALPSVALGGNAVHIVWHDNRDGNNEIYYKQNPTGNPVKIINTGSVIPGSYLLDQNYPNPFNPVTKIRFNIPMIAGVKNGVSGKQAVLLSIYDVLGHEIETLVNENLQPGTYETEFDGSRYPSGVYFYTLVSSHFSQTKKMILVK